MMLDFVAEISEKSFKKKILNLEFGAFYRHVEYYCLLTSRFKIEIILF